MTYMTSPSLPEAEASTTSGDQASTATSPNGTGEPTTSNVTFNAMGDPLPRNWLAVIAVIWCGQAASIFATCAASFAAIWFITETTSSAVWLSLASAASLLPVALLSPLGGVAADRVNRKLVMIAADGGAGLFSLMLGVAALAGFINVPLMLVLLAVRASAQAFHGPALTAALPNLVPESQLVRINALDQGITSLSSIVGPALGILLYNIIGFHGVMFLDAACAALACACLTFAHIPNAASPAQGSVLADLRDGAAFIAGDKGLRSLMMLIMLAMLLLMPASSLFPLMTYEWFGGGGYAASLVEATFGIGLLMGSGVMFAWGGGKKSVPLVLGSGAFMGAALAACGLLAPDQFALFTVLVALVAFGLGCFNAPIMPIMQKRTPDALLGRVMGIFLAGSSLAAPLGLSFSGFIAEAVGVNQWLTLCGIGVFLCCIAASRSKAIRALDEDPARTHE